MIRVRSAAADDAAAPDLVHKCDVGAVRLNLDGPAAVREAHAAVTAALGELSPAVVVQRMDTAALDDLLQHLGRLAPAHGEPDPYVRSLREPGASADENRRPSGHAGEGGTT